MASASRLTFPLLEDDRILQLKISIKDLHHPVWRRVLVPDSITLSELHLVIQNCFQWRNYHLYVFRKGGRSFSNDKKFKDIDGDKDEDSDEVIIAEVLPAPNARLEYEYDFGDGWEHSIRFEKVVPHVEGRVYPVCIAGKFKGPPEDCGSSPGYEDVCKAIAKPASQRTRNQKELIEWLHECYPDYNDPADFTPAQVTFELFTGDDDDDSDSD